MSAVTRRRQPERTMRVDLPEPALFALLDQINELREEIGRVMRSRCGFGMILHTKNRQFLVAHSFDGSVIQIDMSEFDLCGQRFWIHRKPVILGSDRNLAALKILDRLIRPTMSKF